MTKPYERILLTGAAGRLGTELRKELGDLANHVRLADRAPIDDAAAHEEVLTFDLADMEPTMDAVEGCDAVVHFGGAALESPWKTVLGSSIEGSYHIYEGARRAGTRRIVYASSVHAVGYHALADHIDTEAPVRPDSLYGVSKCFVEALSSLYWDKFGVETANLRIFSSFPEPADRRMLWSWLSFADCRRLVRAALTAPHLGRAISFGISDNKVKPVDNAKAGHLGYVAEDSAEPYRAAVEGRTDRPDPKDPAVTTLGGWFVHLGHPDDPDAA